MMSFGMRLCVQVCLVQFCLFVLLVQKGLIVPGEKGVEVEHGSRYGVGIYLSPNADFSLQ